MKRLVLILSVILIGVSGCGVTDVFKDEPELTSLTGILEEQVTSDTDVKGTHLLITESEDEGIPLRSLSINLSTNNYLGNKIQVIGFMNEEDGVFEVTGVSVIEALHEIEMDADFVTYKNTDFGIQLKYYNDWEMDELDSQIIFSSPVEEEGEAQDVIEIIQSGFSYQPTISEEGGEDTPLLAYMAENYSGVEDPESLINKIGVDGLDAVRITDESGAISYYLYRNGLIYEIRFNPVMIDSENKNIFNEMMAEFKFTGFSVEGEVLEDDDNSVDVDVDGDAEITELPTLEMNFSSFESLPFLFAGKYPASWYYSGASGGEGILRHYGFSDESVTEDNELISLDVISGDIPSGQKISGDDKELVIVESGGTYSVYTSVDGQNYKLSGDKEYSDVILHMANSIVVVEQETE
jgi:hypothetical protein